MGAGGCGRELASEPSRPREKQCNMESGPSSLLLDAFLLTTNSRTLRGPHKLLPFLVLLAIVQPSGDPASFQNNLGCCQVKAFGVERVHSRSGVSVFAGEKALKVVNKQESPKATRTEYGNNKLREHEESIHATDKCLCRSTGRYQHFVCQITGSNSFR